MPSPQLLIRYRYIYIYMEKLPARNRIAADNKSPNIFLWKSKWIIKLKERSQKLYSLQLQAIAELDLINIAWNSTTYFCVKKDYCYILSISYLYIEIKTVNKLHAKYLLTKTIAIHSTNREIKFSHGQLFPFVLYMSYMQKHQFLLLTIRIPTLHVMLSVLELNI